MAPKAKLSHAEFVLKAIDAAKAKAKAEGKPLNMTKGVHVVYSGFNDALRAYFPDEQPRAITEQLVTQGVIASRGCRGGAMVYRPEDAPAVVNKGTALIASMGV